MKPAKDTWSAADIDYLLQVADMMNVASLDLAIDEEGNTLGSFVADPGPGVESLAIDHERDSLVNQMLRKVLDAREIYIIENRFGFNGEVKTLDDVGQVLGITRERVRQIEKRAMRKLSVYAKKHNMGEYL